MVYLFTYLNVYFRMSILWEGQNGDARDAVDLMPFG